MRFIYPKFIEPISLPFKTEDYKTRARRVQASQEHSAVFSNVLCQTPCNSTSEASVVAVNLHHLGLQSLSPPSSTASGSKRASLGNRKHFSEPRAEAAPRHPAPGPPCRPCEPPASPEVQLGHARPCSFCGWARSAGNPGQDFRGPGFLH